MVTGKISFKMLVFFFFFLPKNNGLHNAISSSTARQPVGTIVTNGAIVIQRMQAHLLRHGKRRRASVVMQLGARDELVPGMCS